MHEVTNTIAETGDRKEGEKGSRKHGLRKKEKERENGREAASIFLSLIKKGLVSEPLLPSRVSKKGKSIKIMKPGASRSFWLGGNEKI